MHVNDAIMHRCQAPAFRSTAYESFGFSWLSPRAVLHGGLWRRAQRGGTGAHAMPGEFFRGPIPQ